MLDKIQCFSFTTPLKRSITITIPSFWRSHAVCVESFQTYPNAEQDSMLLFYITFETIAFCLALLKIMMCIISEHVVHYF